MAQHKQEPDLDDSVETTGATKELTRRQRDIAVIGWSSFLVAAGATMLFFAFIDPAALVEASFAPLPTDRMAGYAVGFFFFWLISAAAAAMTILLIRTRSGHIDAP